MTEIPLADPCLRCERFTVPRDTWMRLTRTARRAVTAEGHRRRGPRGLCSACYQYARDHDLLDHYPLSREQVPADVLLDEYAMVRADLPAARAERLQVAARRIGVSPYALEKALERAGVAA